jgi:hypothetical protein
MCINHNYTRLENNTINKKVYFFIFIIKFENNNFLRMKILEKIDLTINKFNMLQLFIDKYN